MKLLIPLLFACSLVGVAARADENAVAHCPIETGVFRDGGSHFMKIPSYGELPSIEIILDGRTDTKTPNEYYIASDFNSQTGQPTKISEVLRAFKQAESVLLSKYGMEYVYQVAMNPLVVGENVKQDEYVKRLSDSKFIERIDVSEVLFCIQTYRSEHRTESGPRE